MQLGRTLAIGLVALLAACSGRDDGDTGGITTTTIGDSTGTNTDTNDDGPMKFDVGGDETGMEAGDEAGDDGCEKVDILFVIDNSGSMEDEQVNLINSFPQFIDEIQTQLADTEGYHVGVTTSDAPLFNGAGCTLEGSLITQSQMGACGPYAEGWSYMTEMDNLATTFSCAANVGITGDGNERPMQTMQAAIGPGLNADGQCNAGFIRDDALLVIVIITDEEDDHELDGCAQLPQPGSNGDPPGWFQGAIAAKGGVEQNIVVLALVGPPGPDPAICPALDKCTGGIIGAEVGARIVQFTQMFSNGFVGRVCENSYGPFFAEAVGVIKSACDNFMPPG
jgi:hypothetical protein